MATYNLDPYRDQLLDIQTNVNNNSVLQEFMKKTKRELEVSNANNELRKVILNEYVSQLLGELNNQSLSYADSKRLLLHRNVQRAKSFVTKLLDDARGSMPSDEYRVLEFSLVSLSDFLESFELFIDIPPPEKLPEREAAYTSTTDNEYKKKKGGISMSLIVIGIIIFMVVAGLVYWIKFRKEGFRAYQLGSGYYIRRV